MAKKQNTPRKPLVKKPRSNCVSELTEPHANAHNRSASDLHTQKLNSWGEKKYTELELGNARSDSYLEGHKDGLALSEQSWMNGYRLAWFHAACLGLVLYGFFVWGVK